MKSGSKLLYAIGFVFNCIAIVALIIIVALFGVALGGGPLIIEQVAQDIQQTVEYVRETLLITEIVCGIELAIHIALLFVVLYARKCLVKKTGNVSPHLIILLAGIFSFNLLYLLGGIFGMVAASNDNEDE